MIVRSARLAVIAFAALMTGTAHAADFVSGGQGTSPVYNDLFDFEGFYVGATGGIGTFPPTGGVGTVGVVAGANFEVTDAILAGLEFQGDSLWNESGFAGWNTLLLGKLGSYLSDDMVVYASAGGGWIDGDTSYGFGAGVEWALAQQISVRGEAMGTGTFGAMPNGAKATLGLIWHLD